MQPTMPQSANEQNNNFLLCLISLAFVFPGFISAHTEGNFTLFGFTFLRLSHTVLYYG